MNRIKVSFVVIALNAAATITTLFDCIKRQTYPHELIEIILVDGCSIDGTKEIMEKFALENCSFGGIQILNNPGKTLPCGWNIALKAVSGDAIVRVDAHCFISDDFIELNVCNIEKGENICGGKVVSIPAENTAWSIVVNEAENSMFGGSFATFRHAETVRYVDTAAFAMYRKCVFDNVGYYNEILTRTEDNEMHYRIRRAGYKFYYDPQIVSYRKTRPSFGKLLKQKYLNGYWIGRTLGIEPRCISIYHFVPLAFVIAIILTLCLSLSGILWPMVTLCCLYGAVNISISVIAALSNKEKNIYYLCLPLIFLMLHICYGVGTVIGIIQIYKNCY